MFPTTDIDASEQPRSAARAVRRLAVLSAAVLCALWAAAAPVEAAQRLSSSGSVGWVHGEGHMICNPFPSSGAANRYIELGAPLVGEVAPSRPVYVGGNQQIYWRPQLEKYVNGAWRAVWLGNWVPESSYGTPSTFANQFVDVYSLAGGGSGYYRMSATIWWLADANYAGGWMNYRLTTGNYFQDSRMTPTGMAPYPVGTPYCQMR